MSNYSTVLEINLEEIKKSLHERVPDFASKIAPVYKTLGWTWGTDEVPDTTKIGDVLHELINKMERYDDFGEVSCGTGGLEVFASKVKHEYGIRFIYEDLTCANFMD